MPSTSFVFPVAGIIGALSLALASFVAVKGCCFVHSFSLFMSDNITHLTFALLTSLIKASIA